MMKRILTILALFLLFSARAEDKIIFVPGWLSHPLASVFLKNANYELHLRQIWKKETIKIQFWESTRGWNQSRDNADKFAETLAKELIAMPEAEREKTILIGHSLGGRITVKTLAILAQKDIKVRQGIALGAAIPADCSELQAALRASERPFINIFSYDDNVLKYAYGNAERIFALGFCGSYREYDHLKQYTFVNPNARDVDLITEAKELMLHSSALYIRKLRDVREGNLAEFKHQIDHRKVIIEPPLDIIPDNIILPPVGKMKVEMSCEQWRLVSVPANTDALLKKEDGEKKYFYLILDPYGRWRYWTFSRDKAFVHFDSVKSQIEKLRLP